LKPDFVFFGEPIPEPARSSSFGEAEIADVFLEGKATEVMTQLLSVAAGGREH
jgi:NAD-dependent deacetylase